MSRSYRVNIAHQHEVYRTADVMALYQVSRNTITNWIAQGFRPVPGTLPKLFRGDELKRFQDFRSALNKTQLRPGEFKCFGCKAAVLPVPDTLVLPDASEGGKAHGLCPDCGKKVFKIISETECNLLRLGTTHNTTAEVADEYSEHIASGIVTPAAETAKWNPNNEQLIYEWQTYAGKYANATRLAHLASIRHFEDFIEGKDFTQVTDRDADRYRQMLVAAYRSEDVVEQRSSSTVRHRASQVQKFFTWLSMKMGSQQLQLVAECFDLPKSIATSEPSSEPRLSLELDEAIDILDLLPSLTLIDRRNRAMFALAYMSALRESALISLRMEHVDLRSRTVTQDGRVTRAKNGKSFRVKWFPRTQAFQTIFCAWFDEASRLGLSGQDALFPDSRHLERPASFSKKSRAPIPVMKSAQTMDRLFEQVSALAGKKITPHSVRNTIAKLGYEVARSPEARKAWSQNFGHESEATTWGYYGKLGDERRFQVLESFSEVDTLTNDERDLLVLLLIDALPNGTPEFWEAKRLQRQLEDRMNPNLVQNTKTRAK